MTNVIGQRQSEQACQISEMFKPNDALRIGLVDDVVPATDVLSTARSEVEKWVKIPGNLLIFYVYQMLTC